MGGMKDLRYWPQLGAALVVAVIGALWFFTADFPYQDRIQQVAGNAFGPVDSAHELMQTFKVSSDSLSRVDLYINKDDPGSQGRLRLQIMEYKGTQPDGAPDVGEVLGETELDTGSFDYVGVQQFEFEPVTVTPGATYAFRVSSNDAAPAGVWVMGSDADQYSGGSLFKDGMPVNGDLYFALFHEEDAAGLLAKNEPFRPWPLDSPVLFAILFLVGAGSFGWLLWEVAAGTVEEDEEG